MEFNVQENRGVEMSEMRPEKSLNPPLANKNSFELCDELCELTCTNTFDIDKSSLSVTNETLTPNTLIKVEPKVTNSSDNKLYDKHSSFRSTRMRGTSSDRIIAKKRHDQKSVSSLSERMSDTTGSLFEKHLGKFYKLGKLEKQNRFSSNTLYDQSPTEAFYNKTGSARLSSQELFEKFCSEDFISLYGHENDNGNYNSQSQISSDYSKSLECSTQGRNIQKEIRNIEIPENYYENREKSISYSSLGAIRKTKIAHMKKYDTIMMSRSPGVLDHRHKTHFNFDIPFSLPLDIIHYEIDDALETATQNEPHSRSAPLLSPDKNETQFNFEVIDVSQCDGEESPSDATETRNLTLYEEPRSDRTSLSDFFDFGLRSKPSSFKRDFAYKSKPIIDLTNLDFRAIDDESPNTSKFVSMSSPDEMNPSNFDAKSCYSDSVFVSPEKTISKEETTSKQTDSSAKQRQISESLEVSSLNTPTPVYEKSPEHGNLQKYGSLADITEKTLSPLPEHCDLESLSDSIKLSEEHSENPKDSILLNAFQESPIIASRPSMHKLKPYHPEPSSSITKDEPDNMATEQYDKILDIPELSRKRDKSMCFKIKKIRDSSTVTVHRRTKCFPL